ncbi:MAG: DUF4132 domain-containing protein [Rhodocyclaceae bacterium]|nr:DUF4132 domain-containing protein [Rhodocyclaceae bacterium]
MSLEMSPGADEALSVLAAHANSQRPMEYAAFARVLVGRLSDGRAEEVEAFCRECEVVHLQQLSQLRDEGAPWHQDADVWRSVARLMIPRGVALLSLSEGVPVRGPELAAELRALAEAWLAHCRKNGFVGRDQVGVVIARLLPLMHYPGMPSAACIEHVEWALALRKEAGIGPNFEYFTAWKPFLHGLDDVTDLITLAQHGGLLCKNVLETWKHRIQEEKLPTPAGWAPWHEFFATHPEIYDADPVWDAGLAALRWPDSNRKQRKVLANILLSEISYHQQVERDYIHRLFDRLVRDDVEVFADLLKESGRYDISVNLAQWVFEGQYEALLPLLLPLIAMRCEYEEEGRAYRDIACRLASSRPDDLAAVPVKELVNLLPVLDAGSLKGALPVLTKVVAGSTSKALREALAAGAQRFEPADLVAAGWLKKPPKNLLLTCRDVLLKHPDPAAGPLLAELLASGKLDVASASMVEARLQQLGLAVDKAAAEAVTPGTAAAADTLDDDPAARLAALEAQAARVKRIAATVKAFDTPDNLALLAPLSEHAARALLHLVATAEDSLPPLVGQLLEPVPADARARFALMLVETWIASHGEPKLRWALRLLPGNADDRVVDQLVAAITAWNKPRLQRAAAATEQLGEVDTLYALLRVQEISESRKLKDMVLGSARVALRAAAQRRQITLSDLFDELTPDFGLGNGLALTVGPNAYRVELQGDLSLRVINDKGKASKSVPAVKDAALKPAWEAATAKLKGMASNLKTVVKQQAPRMHAALVTGKRWPLARWQRLFLQHPLLRIVGRSLIWRAEEAPGRVRTSFRIAEDFSLVDVEDDVLKLPDGCHISLWHPATAEAGEQAAWQAYFADYELEPMVDQLGACAELPPPEWFKDEQLVIPPGLEVAQEHLASLLKKWGYRPGPVGDGPSINEHCWHLPALEMGIQLDHGYFPPWMDIGNPVAIESFRVRDLSQYWAWLKPADLPVPLQATLMGQIRALQAKAMSHEGEQ